MRHSLTTLASVFVFFLSSEAESDMGDYLYINSSANRVCGMGGCSYAGSYCGMFYFYLSSDASRSNTDCGFRVFLSYLFRKSETSSMGDDMSAVTANDRVCFIGCGSNLGAGMFSFCFNENATRTGYAHGFRVIELTLKIVPMSFLPFPNYAV